MKKKPLPRFKRRFVTESPGETQKLAAKIARRVRRGDTLLLDANLGVGKTTFAQGFVHAMGVREAALSPTFIFAQSFKGRIPIHHLDFYRATPKELLDIGVQDYLTGSGALEKGVVMIEWASRGKKFWPAEHLEIKMKINKSNFKRAIEITGVGKRAAELVKKLS